MLDPILMISSNIIQHILKSLQRFFYEWLRGKLGLWYFKLFWNGY